MNKLFTLLIIVITTINFTYAQVGIGTETPQAMLDVVGDVKIRTVNVVSPLTDAESVIVTGADNFLQQASYEDLTSKLKNTTIYSANKDGSWQLLSLGISGTNWSKISLTGGADTEIGNPALFTNSEYTAPEDGIYAINYEFQLEGGVDLSLLGNKKLGIIRNNTIVLREKLFDAVRVSILGVTLASVPVTSTDLNMFVELNAGDVIVFAVETGGVNLSLLTDNKVSLSIHKISDLID